MWWNKEKGSHLTYRQTNENPQMSHGGPSHRQTSDTDPPIKDETKAINRDLGLLSGMQTVAIYPCYIPLFYNAWRPFKTDHEEEGFQRQTK